MGWTLELYTAQPELVSANDLAVRLIDIAPLLQVATLRRTKDATLEKMTVLDSDGHRQAVVSSVDFDIERQADTEFAGILETEIAESGDEDGATDEEYTRSLVELLRGSTKHYIISGTQDNSPDQRQVVVRVAYALSQMVGGLIHDLQSGDWMDAGLFESLLDAYGAYATL